MKKPNPKIRANFTIDAGLLRKFRNYCKDEGLKMSTIIEKFIKNLLEKS